MKLSKQARVKKNLASATDIKKVLSSIRTMFDYHLISPRRALYLARTFGHRGGKGSL